MKKIRFLLILAATTCLFTTSHAQSDNIRNIFFDTIRTGDVHGTPIGVDEMKYVGNQYISYEDSVLMRYTTGTVQYDIDFFADFELIPLDSFYLKTYEIFEMDILGWRRLGADLLVRLETEFPGTNMRVRWKLFDTIQRQQVARGTVEHHKSMWRTIGHEIANEIVHTLTGEDGIFLTSVTYIKRIGEAKELFISDFDGANERQLTENGSINLSPAFAPDGKLIYFTSYVEGDPKLFSIDVETRKMTKVAEFPGIVAAPTVSPDGNKIACTLSKDGNSEIYVLSTKGKIIKRLTWNSAIDTAPTWSPDGQMIAFSSDRTGSPQIYLMDSDGLNQQRLTWEGRYNDSPIWSSRGDRITFVSRTQHGRFDLASINTSGTDFRVLTEVGMNENPHFSPDGKHIIFSSTRLSPRDIYTMDITGRNQRRLTSYGKCSNPNWGPIP